MNENRDIMDAEPEFDPYYLWLGIPPAEQPPNHYRLLGVTIFEANPEVIDAAAFRQTIHLRTYAAGPHSDQSQKLLNEVAAAKICLSQPEKKSAYDAEVGARLTQVKKCLAPQTSQGKSAVKIAAPKETTARPTFAIEAQPPANARPQRPKGSAPLAERLQTSPLSASKTPSPLRRRSKRAKWVAWPRLVTGGGIVAALGLGLLLFGEFGRSDEHVAETIAKVIPPTQNDPIPAFHPAASAPPAVMAAPTEAPPEARPSSSSPTTDDAAAPQIAPPPLALTPFDADEAHAHQDAWAAHLKTPPDETNSIGIKFKLIPPGKFVMGSTKAEIDAAAKVLPDRSRQLVKYRGPPHDVTLYQPFYLGAFEVTQAQYVQIMGVNPSHFSSQGAGRAKVQGLNTDQFPVDRTSWDDAVEFCRKLSALAAEITAGREYRLPTEAEWEYACQAGSPFMFCFGDEVSRLDEHGWYDANSQQRPWPVGQKHPNAWGLFDMHGNAWEWCQDWFAEYTEFAVSDPTGPEIGTARSIRGGSFNHPPWNLASKGRDLRGPTERAGTDVSFRVVMTHVLSPQEAAKNVTELVDPPRQR